MDQRKHGSVDNIVRLILNDSAGRKTGVAYDDAGLKVSIAPDNAAAAGFYNYASGSTILQMTGTIGTHQDPTTSSDIRFIEVDDTNQPGLYELHIRDEVFATSGAKKLIVTVQGSDFDPTSYEINLDPVPVNVEEIGEHAGYIELDGINSLYANIQGINSVFTPAMVLRLLYNAIPVLTIDTFYFTATKTQANFNEAFEDNDLWYEKALLLCVSGQNKGSVATRVTGYSWDGTASQARLTFDELEKTPNNGDVFILIGRWG